MRRWQAIGWIGLMVAAPAWAQAPYVPLEQRLPPQALAEVGLSPAQLQALNRLLREAEVASPPPALAASVPQGASTPANAGLPTPAPMFPGLDDGPIHAKVSGQVEGWQPGTVFTLDNGQQWQVLKGEMKLRAARSNPDILVVPGIAGRWFLQVDEDLPKARVFRIR